MDQVVDFYNHQSLLESTIFTSANYIEILAFVPAVWMVHTTVKKGEERMEDHLEMGHFFWESFYDGEPRLF